VAFFCKDVDVSDSRFDVNKDVVDCQLISEVESNLEEEVGKATVEEDMNGEEVVAIVDEKTY